MLRQRILAIPRKHYFTALKDAIRGYRQVANTLITGDLNYWETKHTAIVRFSMNVLQVYLTAISRVRKRSNNASQTALNR